MNAVANRATGLSVTLVDGQLVISIGIDSLMTAVRGADFWDDEEYTILDPDVLAQEIVDELVREQEDGTTPVHLMIDAAAEEAVDQGSQAIGDGEGNAL